MTVTPPQSAVDPQAADKPEQAGPIEFRDPVIRHEFKRAMVWAGVVLAIMGVIVLAEPLMLIFAGIVLASMLDGGTRLLGRVLPIGRGWRLTIVTLAAVGFVAWTFYYAGTELVAQTERLKETISGQIDRIFAWAQDMGLVQGGGRGTEQLSSQLMGTLGRLGSAVSTALGAITSAVMIFVIGIFIAVEPRLYQRGVAWMLPRDSRERFYRTAERMGYTLRRLMAGRLVGMAVEGVGTWALLLAGGVPMATLLGILTGLLAFLPNIGAIVSGVLIVLAGFSVDVNHGLWAVAVYFIVQTVDGYLIVPYVAKKTVDLAPALVLGAQLLAGALFGIMGLMLADPMVAMIKTGLEQKSDDDKAEAEAEALVEARSQAYAAAAADPEPPPKRRFLFRRKPRAQAG
ncbi:MAG TPA: AI-2E family transporter [Allosphingosinicella sp.]|nr:AI-2E family transporter [Allosphingosinicella sp.]